MDIFREITHMLEELLDIEGTAITPETYVVRDLGAESIDLLELAVVISSRFEIEVNDNEMFLRTLRPHVLEAEQTLVPAVDYLQEKYPFLDRERLQEIVADMKGGPTLKVRDLADYIGWKLTGR